MADIDKVIPDAVRNLGGVFHSTSAGLRAITTGSSTPGVLSGLPGTSVADACTRGAKLASDSLRTISGHVTDLGDHTKRGAAEYDRSEHENVDFFRLDARS